MKIVIAAPLYPPQVGGPSYYAKGLEDALCELGHDVETVAYGTSGALPMGVSHLSYLFRIFPRLRGAHVVIALDTASVAIPAWLAARIYRIPFLIRTGGDFVWEHYLERTKHLVPLPVFYNETRRLSFKERLVFILTRFIVRRSVMIFSTEMQRDVWTRPYEIRAEKTYIIENAVDEPLLAGKPTRKNFLWHVRPIAMKNGENLHEAFTAAKVKYPDICLEEGILPKTELLGHMKDCYAVVLPSISEISPNYILDALRFKKPFILDKYSGFAKWLEPYGTLIDPLDVSDIQRGVEYLANEEGYKDAVLKVSQFSFVRTYGEVAKDFLSIIERLI